MAKNNRKQSPEECYTNKYQKHVAYSCGYKFVCFDDKFSKLFESYLLNFIISMTEESK